MTVRDPGLRSELLERVRPLIDRLSNALVGEGCGTACYALANLLVTCWRKTGLTRADLHEVIDEVYVAAEAAEAESALTHN